MMKNIQSESLRSCSPSRPRRPATLRPRTANSLDTSVGGTFAVKPDVGVWFDVSRKVGINVTAGYMIARPKLTVTNSLGSDVQRIHTDQFMLRVGAVVKIF